MNTAYENINIKDEFICQVPPSVSVNYLKLLYHVLLLLLHVLSQQTKSHAELPGKQSSSEGHERAT